jgi:hypothetical protein
MKIKKSLQFKLGLISVSLIIIVQLLYVIISHLLSNLLDTPTHHYGFYVNSDSSQVAFWAPVKEQQQLGKYKYVQDSSSSGMDSLYVTLKENVSIGFFGKEDTILWHLYPGSDTNSVAIFNTGQKDKKHHSDFFYGNLKKEKFFLDLIMINEHDTSAALPYHYGKKVDTDSMYATFYVVAPADTALSPSQAFCVVNLYTYMFDIVDGISFVAGEGDTPDTFTVHVRTHIDYDSSKNILKRNPDLSGPYFNRKQIKISSHVNLNKRDSKYYRLVTQTEVTYVDSNNKKEPPPPKVIKSSVPIKSYDDPHTLLGN